MKARLTVCLALLTAAASAQTPNIVYIITEDVGTHAGRMSAALIHDERGTADEYARVSNLPTLSDDSPDEVRFWLTGATFDPSTNGIATVGYVITDGEWKLCRIGYRGKSTVPTSGLCERDAPRATREQVRAHLGRLAAFADFSIGCDTLDGEWMTIDVVSNGKRFVVSASNPDSCRGEAAEVVARFLTSVRD